MFLRQNLTIKSHDGGKEGHFCYHNDISNHLPLTRGVQPPGQLSLYLLNDLSSLCSEFTKGIIALAVGHLQSMANDCLCHCDSRNSLLFHRHDFGWLKLTSVTCALLCGSSAQIFSQKYFSASKLAKFTTQNHDFCNFEAMFQIETRWNYKMEKVYPYITVVELSGGKNHILQKVNIAV